jgi:hypothetical protein
MLSWIFFTAITIAITLLVIRIIIILRRNIGKIVSVTVDHYPPSESDGKLYLWIGAMHFNYPPIMKTYTKYRVSVTISDFREIYLRDSSTGETYIIQVSDIMKCVLKGDGFEIEPLNTETQGLLDDQETGWQWDIKSIKKGRQALMLIVSMQLNFQGRIAFKDIPVFERPVIVKVNTPKHIKKFAQKNWQWLVGAILGSGILWQLLKMFVFKEK